jgi:hypothetical protein
MNQASGPFISRAGRGTRSGEDLMAPVPFEHASEASAALSEVAAEHGPEVLSEPEQLGNLLADLLPFAPGAIRVIVAAAEDRVAETVSGHVAQGLSVDAAIRLTANSFARSSLSAPPVCLWVAGAFAQAAGLNQAPTQPAPAPPQGWGTTPAYTWPAAATAQNAVPAGPGPRPVPAPFPPYQPVVPRSTAPQPVQNAVKLMYAGAGLTAILLIVDIAVKVPFAALVSALGIIGWVGMALANGAGLNWARITSTVLFGIFSVSLLVTITVIGGLGILLEAATWVVGVAALVQLWSRQALGYFKPAGPKA